MWKRSDAMNAIRSGNVRAVVALSGILVVGILMLPARCFAALT